MRQNRCESQNKQKKTEKTKNLLKIAPKTESRRPLPSPGSQILMDVEEGSNNFFHLVKFEILSGHLRDKEDQYDINVIVLHMSHNTHFH